jgi:hypothetical protein
MDWFGVKKFAACDSAWISETIILDDLATEGRILTFNRASMSFHNRKEFSALRRSG